MLDWLDAIPNLGVPGVPGVPPQKSAGYSGTPRESAGVPGVPARPAETPRAVLNRWRSGLRNLRDDQPPASIQAKRWRRLIEDADWLLAVYGEQLAREGWADEDAFGVSLRSPTGEVLLDRLDGSRSVRFDGNGRAAWGWSYTTVIMQACRGYAAIQPAGMIAPLWALPR